MPRVVCRRQKNTGVERSWPAHVLHTRPMSKGASSTRLSEESTNTRLAHASAVHTTASIAGESLFSLHLYVLLT